MIDRTAITRQLNDELRWNIGTPGMAGKNKIVMTRGIAALSPEAAAAIMMMVRDFNDFTPDNDPYGEHDFGTFEYAGERIFWQIAYYDNDLKYGSDNPDDERITTRVLTVMLASEY